MSVRIEEQNKPNSLPTESRAFSLAKFLSTLFYGIAAISLFASTAFLLYTFANGQVTKPLLATHVQNILCSAAIVFIAYQIYQIVASCESKEAFFQAKQTKRIRRIALALVLVLLAQIMIQTVFSAHGIDSQDINVFDPSHILGFPDSAMWNLFFEKDRAIPKTSVTIPATNFGLAASALALWCLSFAFEKGLELQEEQEQTL